MNILFLDDDPKRHEAFHKWMARVQNRQKRATWLHIFKAASKRGNAQIAHVEAVFTVEEAIQSLQNCERFDIAFLDHDLDGRTFVEEREGTGTEVAEFIETMKATQRPRRIIVHSHNPAGARRMADILTQCFCSVEVWPFGSEGFSRALREL